MEGLETRLLTHSNVVVYNTIATGDSRVKERGGGGGGGGSQSTLEGPEVCFPGKLLEFLSARGAIFNCV